MVELAARGRPGLCVLVADNDQLIRSIVRSLLLKLGKTVIEASESEEVLAKASATQVDLVILDLEMPERGGLDVCRRLRQMPQYAAVPIVILTAHDRPEIQASCRAAGATRFMSKPFNPAGLVRLVAPFLALDDHGTEAVSTLVRQDRGLLFQDIQASRSNALVGAFAD